MKNNCFDVVRLTLAGIVLVSHGCELSGFWDSSDGNFIALQKTIGSLSVMGFFGISGYLVTASWEKRKSLPGFVGNRLSRIFPAYLMCLVFVAAVIGPALQIGRGMSLKEYPLFEAQGALSYIYINSMLFVKQWSIGTVLDGAPFPGSLNGSTWSIYPELTCYILTAFLGLTGVLGQNKIIPAILAGYLVLLNVAFVVDAPGQPGGTYPALGPAILMTGKGPGFYLAYLTGSCLWIFRDKYAMDRRSTCFLIGCVVLHVKYGGLKVVAPVILPAMLISVSQSWTMSLKKDISYGVYLYHFPVYQLLALSSWLRNNPLCFVVSGGVIATLLAMLSWNFVESRFQKRRQ